MKKDYPPCIKLARKSKQNWRRIFLSSCADNFEVYLSDLHYEIYLAKSQTLKISVKEVLCCQARKKLSKLQRGSKKGFLENKQSKGLNVIDEYEVVRIGGILQIRHLYSHMNGIIDDKFMSFFRTGYTLNEEHRMSINEVLNKQEPISPTVYKIDLASLNTYELATI